MNSRTSIWSQNFKVIMLVMVTVLFAQVALCGTAANDALFASPPFANPDEGIEMSQEWIQQEVEHPEDVNADLNVVVSYQIVDTWLPWIEDFAKSQKVKIHHNDGVDGTSAGALRRKEVDVACYCGSPKKTDRMPGVRFHTVGVTPVAFFVHPSNPIKDLSLETLMSIFSGEINNWAEVGGDVASIVPVARSHCKKRLGRWRPLDNMNNLSPSAITVGSIDDALKYVAATPGSIGYEILPSLDPYIRAGQIKVLSVSGMNPYNLNLLSQGLYPLYRHYTLATWEDTDLENSLARDFINMLTDKTREDASRIFFVPASDLRESGWKFHGEELVGEPAVPDPT